MSKATPRPRLAIGQLLLGTLREFREQLLADSADAAVEAGVELRMTHLHVFGNIKAEGTRLSDLAAAAGISRPSMAEIVDDLERDGFVERRSDPADGRAKLVVLTEAGWNAIRVGRAIIGRIEADYARRIGRDRFEAMCIAMQDLLDDLADESPLLRRPTS